MKSKLFPDAPCNWLPPQTWPEAFAVIIGLDIAFLGVAFLLDWLYGLLPR